MKDDDLNRLLTRLEWLITNKGPRFGLLNLRTRQTDRHVNQYEVFHPAVTNLLYYIMSISECSSEILIHTVMHQRNLTFVRRNV